MSDVANQSCMVNCLDLWSVNRDETGLEVRLEPVWGEDAWGTGEGPTMIRTRLLVILLGIGILIGIGFVCVSFVGNTPRDWSISETGFSEFTGFIIMIGSFRARISSIRRSQF